MLFCFLEWISQNYPRNRIFLDSVLYDKELVMSYAEEYLYKEQKDYDYKQCKRILKRVFITVHIIVYIGAIMNLSIC